MAVKRSMLEDNARALNEATQAKASENKTVLGKLLAEEKVAVVGAPMYQAYFGRQMAIAINGIPVYVPLDGRKYEIPKSYAEVFLSRLRMVNDDLAAQKKFSDVKENFETYAGELNLIRSV